jgi:hypothetical protein
LFSPHVLADGDNVELDLSVGVEGDPVITPRAFVELDVLVFASQEILMAQPKFRLYD